VVELRRVGGESANLRVRGSFVGSAKDLDALLDALVRNVGSGPTTQTATEKTYIDAMRYFGGCSQLTAEKCHVITEGGQLEREGFVASSRMLEAPMSDPSRVTALVSNFTGLDLLFDSLGGAVGEIAPDATAFPHRRALASVQIYKGTTSQTRTAATRDVGDVQAALATIVGQGAYINYIDPNMKSWAEAAYGDNLARLQEVSQKHDADGFFSFAQALAGPR
jgi:hypothetical protein